MWQKDSEDKRHNGAKAQGQKGRAID